MPVNFTCPHCGLQTLVPDEYAGQSGSCIGCSRPITVPQPPSLMGYVPAAKLPPSRLSRWLAASVLGLTALAILSLVGFLVLGAVLGARHTGQTKQCQANLRRLGVALRSYQAEYGCFPPAYAANQQGKPMHSWRVLILPQLGQQSLYKQYRFDQPWNSPNNRALVAQMPKEFHCPASPDDGTFQTNYVMIVGKGMLSDGTSVSRSNDITDGESKTFLLVEGRGPAVNWMDPRDLDAGTLSFSINDGVGTGIQSEHSEAVNVLYCDGSVRSLPASTDPDEVKAQATIAGGETIDDPSAEPKPDR